MEKVDIGYLRAVATKRGVLKDCVITDLSFTSLDVPAGLHNIDNEQCYLVKKSDLDAYEARIEQLKRTPVRRRIMRVVKVIPRDSMELSDILVEEDPFYGGIFIAQEHIDAWRKEFDTERKAEDSLVEEMTELIQAINKQRRSNTKQNKDAIREEMAHVLISLKGLCRYKMITPGEIEKETQAKWPAAYEPEKGECKDCYWSMKEQHNDVVTVLRCTARCNTACDYCGPCDGFAKKEEK